MFIRFGGLATQIGAAGASLINLIHDRGSNRGWLPASPTARALIIRIVKTSLSLQKHSPVLVL